LDAGIAFGSGWTVLDFVAGGWGVALDLVDDVGGDGFEGDGFEGLADFDPSCVFFREFSDETRPVALVEPCADLAPPGATELFPSEAAFFAEIGPVGFSLGFFSDFGDPDFDPEG
jgi:hypothetical protein